MFKGRTGFDNEAYLQEQAECIRQRMNSLNGRLYLEFGGKLLNDFHAARVLPGYDPNVKIRLLKELEEDAEILLCIHEGAIEHRKVRADYGITYDVDAMKLIDDLGEWGLSISAVVITRWEGRSAARGFRKKLENRGLRVYTHRPIPGYPADSAAVVSARGFGANKEIPLSKPLVVVTGPGPGSGKMASCLSQIYWEHKHGRQANYAKFETFPVWNLPLKHPVNIAYEAATLDLEDSNLIDPYHLKATGGSVVNYNRDIESFPLLEAILRKISVEKDIYCSPTEMGVNRIGFAITDDEVVQEASRQELVHRYFRCACEYMMGVTKRAALEKAEMLLKELGITPEYRPVVTPARKTARQAEAMAEGSRTVDGVYCGAAIQLADGTIITGKNSILVHAATAVIINAVKHLAGLPDSIHLLSPIVIESIGRFKRDILKRQSASLDVDEVLIALSISAALNPAVQACLDCLPQLAGCQMHLTHMPPPGDEAGLRKLGIILTSDPVLASSRLFVE